MGFFRPEITDCKPIPSLNLLIVKLDSVDDVVLRTLGDVVLLDFV